jgi:nucleoside-diphosphate-sugar epimerase
MNRLLLTGATGLIGGDVLLRLLRADRSLRADVLVRDSARWTGLVRRLGPLYERVTPVRADLADEALGLRTAERRRLCAETTLIIHCAADTRFSRPLPEARRHNRDGTRRVLELAAECGGLQRLVHVSTAFVAGRATGTIPERELTPDGWVNAYEQSKHEAERLVRAAHLPWVIVRPSTVVCDGGDGGIRQINAVHRALDLCRAGLAAMVPGRVDTPVDLVTTDYVSGGIARLARAEGVDGRTYHLCAGAGALPLGELLDRALVHWARDARWARRGVARPALASLETYRSFELAIEETGDARLRAITRSLTHFVPQLALSKRFVTDAADAALGYAAPAVASYWTAVLERLEVNRRTRAARSAARSAA